MSADPDQFARDQLETWADRIDVETLIAVCRGQPGGYIDVRGHHSAEEWAWHVAEVVARYVEATREDRLP